jgi:uncharacterized protein YkwD
MPNRSRSRLRHCALALAAAALCAAVVAAPAQTSPLAPGRAAAAADALENAIVDRINAVRKAHGLKALRVSAGLFRVAAAHAGAMARKGFFSHSSADGTSASTRIRRYYGGSAIGETIFWRSPDSTAAQAVQWWLASRPHRAILLSSSFREIGLGAVHIDSAPGVFGGRATTVVVADFGAQ